MELVAHVEPRGDASATGHMVIGQEVGPESVHVGFRFDPDDLPEDYLPIVRWKDYLFDHAVPGIVVDESDYIRVLTRDLGRVYYIKRCGSSVPLQSVLPPEDRWRPHASYSFNPDNFHSADSPCYNCVTWATEVANRIEPHFLVPVRQGRIKLMVEQLRKTLTGVADDGQTDRETVD